MEQRTYRMMRALEDEHWWFVARRRIIETLIARLQLPDPAEILEVGCGTGGNLAMLGGFGNVTGVEQDQGAAAMARERDVATVLPGALPDDLPDLPQRFDLIALLDVIEHIEEDAASLASLSGRLRPGGRILLTVPAFNFLWSRHDEENQHKRRYRRRDIYALATSTDLQVDYATYYNFLLFPPLAAIRVFRKAFPYKETWQDMRKPGRAVNELLRSAFSSEKAVIGRATLPFGLSLLAVLSRSPDRKRS